MRCAEKRKEKKRRKVHHAYWLYLFTSLECFFHHIESGLSVIYMGVLNIRSGDCY